MVELTATVRMVVHKLGCRGEPPTLESMVLCMCVGGREEEVQ